MDAKAFLNNILKSAKEKRIILNDARYEVMVSKFDEKAFYEYIKMIKSDSFSEVCYRLILADEVFDYSIMGDHFIPFIHKFLKCNSVPLDAVFGPYKNEPTPEMNFENCWVTGNYFNIWGKKYVMISQSALLSFLLDHFECKECLRYNGTFLISRDFDSVDIIRNKLKEYFKCDKLDDFQL